jgi:hypothetical protein
MDAAKKRKGPDRIKAAMSSSWISISESGVACATAGAPEEPRRREGAKPPGVRRPRFRERRRAKPQVSLSE